MRITRVKLKHFRSHRHTTLQLERVNFIRGLNKSGKSGLALAIEMALSGRCAKTDEAGRGFEQLIEEGAQSALIVLECQEFTISLTLDRAAGRLFKIETGNQTILGKQAQEWLAEKIAAPDVINATLNAWRFITMTEADQASLLARVLLPAKLELDAEVAAWLKANRLAVVERPTLFGTIEATHKAITAARTAVNSRLRDLKSLVEPDEVSGSRDTVKAKLEALQQQQTEANRKLLILSTREAGDKMDAEASVRSQAEIDDLEKALQQLPPLLTREERAALEKTAALKIRHDEIRALIAAERATVASSEQNIEKLNSGAGKGFCPTCKAALTASSRESMFAPFIALANDASGAIRRLEKELHEGGDSEAAQRRLTADAQDRLYREQRAGDLKYRKERHHALYGNGRVREPLDFTDTVASLTEDLNALKTRVLRGLEVLVKIVEMEEAQKAYQKQLAERKTAEERHAELEKLLTYFGPHGIKAKLIAERLDLFTQRVNAVLSWWGYSLAFTIEPYSLRITSADAPHLSLTPKQLSESECYRLGVAFAIAIAQWTGVKLLIADAAEILDKPDKWNFAQGLLASDLDQAILTSTGIAGTFEAEGTTFYTLSKTEGITATELDAQTAATLQTAAV